MRAAKIVFKSFIIATTVSLSVVGQSVPANDWKEKRVVRYGGEADIIVRTGDIDNFGFGWYPDDFNPFCGETTRSHSFPWRADPEDPDGTDRIFVGSSVNGSRQDGYSVTPEPRDTPRAIVLKYDIKKIKPKRVLLQIFVDDFQPRRFSSHFQVSLNGIRIPPIETAINSLDQTGPVGRLLTFSILPEYFGIIRSGEVRLLIDDPQTSIGDGYAVDFAQIIINPKQYPFTGIIEGRIRDEKTGDGVEGALVSAGNAAFVISDSNGGFSLKEVPAGLAIVSVMKQGYATGTDTYNVECGAKTQREMKVARISESSGIIGKALDRDGEVILYGITFRTGSDDLTPESIPVLSNLLEVLKSGNDFQITITGHTDADGGETWNNLLSLKRAKRVCAWLVEKGIDKNRLIPKGAGERRPVSDNSTSEGKAANRRVEITIQR